MHPFQWRTEAKKSKKTPDEMIQIKHSLYYDIQKRFKKKKELTFLTSASFSFCCFCDLLFVISCFFLEAFSMVISR